MGHKNDPCPVHIVTTTAMYGTKYLSMPPVWTWPMTHFTP